jgi:flagellar basal-body rod protein FlgG
MAYDITALTTIMDRKIAQMDGVANNLANTSTPGYKAEHLRALQAASESAENTIPETIIDFRPGMPEKTGNALDLRIEGDGFFAVQTREGQAFTRRGDFTIDRENRLVTQEGDPVMGENGLIRLKKGVITIGRDGSVLVDADVAGKLRVVDFENRSALKRIGGSLYKDPGTAGMKKPVRFEISSGFLELSNVDMIREMTEMIDVNRSFESYQKIIQTLSDLDKLSVNRIGRLA